MSRRTLWEIAAFDKESFEDLTGLSITGCEAYREPEIVLAQGSAGAPDAAGLQCNGTVLFENGRYRLWYVAYGEPLGGFEFIGRVAYAESEDGRHWRKPDLQLTEYRGSLHNNLVAGLPEQAIDCVSVLRDDDGKYRMLVNNCFTPASHAAPEHQKRFSRLEPTMPCSEGIAESDDGLHWRYIAPEHPITPEKFEAGRIDKVNGRYIINGQQTHPWYSGTNRNRVVSFWSSDDLKHWKKLPEYYRNEYEYVPCHVGISHVERIGATVVGLTGRFTEAPELRDQHMEIGIVLSQDGLHWHEPAPELAFVRRGQTREWDGGGILQSGGLICNGDESAVLYTGLSGGNSDVGTRQLGRATFPTRRYAMLGLSVGWNLLDDKSATADSKPFELEQPFSVYLNVENLQPGCSELRLQLLRPDGSGLSDWSDPVAANGFAVPVTWEGKSRCDFTGPMRLRIQFRGGATREDSPWLYTIGFLEEK